ncbi:hypothetical protein LTR85_004590 [Meristemomyces frigidus]|nr:hypothetical protein LTR85_004590 [Meristemomyces frigidus]
MSGTSNVGGRGVYEAGDQRNYKDSEIKDAERYKEGQPNSHLANDSTDNELEDERTIANKLAREEKRQNEPEPESEETKQSKKDSTLPVREPSLIGVAGANINIWQATMHGNEPSKGAKIDQELEDEEAEILKKKGAFGPKQ